MSVYQKYTGKYMPKEDRAQVVQDVQNTHFTLGAADHDFSSQYNHQYNNQIRSNSIANNKAMLDIRKRVSQDNVVLGGSPKEINESVAQQAFKFDPKKAQNPTQVNKNLAKHNFAFGYSGQTMGSTSHADFKPEKVRSQAVRQDEFDRVKESVRKVNFSIGVQRSGSQPNLSIAKSDFITKSPPKVENSKVNDKGKTHIFMGNAAQDYSSMQSTHFQSPQNLNKNPSADNLKQSNFKFGNVKPQTETTQKSTFMGKQGSRGKLWSELKTDLVQQHYRLGEHKPNYNTQGMEDYSPGKLEHSGKAAINNFRGSSVIMGINPKSMQVSSVNASYYQRQPIIDSPENIELRDRLKRSQVNLGSDKIYSTTSSKDFFKGQFDPNATWQKDREEAKLQGALQKQSHFPINTMQKTPQSVSHSMLSSPDKIGARQPPARNLHRDHFRFGHEAPSYTTSGSTYDLKPIQNLKGQRSSAQANNIRLGDGKTYHDTNYTANFDWKNDKY